MNKYSVWYTNHKGKKFLQRVDSLTFYEAINKVKSKEFGLTILRVELLEKENNNPIKIVWEKVN